MYSKKENLKTSLKTGFAQISLPAQKTWVTQNFGGAAALLAPPPPARTPMGGGTLTWCHEFCGFQVSFSTLKSYDEVT